VPLGWPVNLARQYLTKNLRFQVGARELEGVQAFHQLAAEEGIIAACQPLRVWSPLQ
jgi:hypothetical protein